MRPTDSPAHARAGTHLAVDVQSLGHMLKGEAIVREEDVLTGARVR
jgi:hypothetical protein